MRRASVEFVGALLVGLVIVTAIVAGWHRLDTEHEVCRTYADREVC